MTTRIKHLLTLIPFLLTMTSDIQASCPEDEIRSAFKSGFLEKNIRDTKPEDVAKAMLEILGGHERHFGFLTSFKGFGQLGVSALVTESLPFFYAQIPIQRGENTISSTHKISFSVTPIMNVNGTGPIPGRFRFKFSVYNSGADKYARTERTPIRMSKFRSFLTQSARRFGLENKIQISPEPPAGDPIMGEGRRSPQFEVSINAGADFNKAMDILRHFHDVASTLPNAFI